ncbi:MAG TPA: sialidase family protein [Vicinamibacterales bacterium]|jgi:hypothetical protein|nr:sialidase family protein [Vicinamibacterales bacterium]
MTRRLPVSAVLLILLAAACGHPSEQASPPQEPPFGVVLRPSAVPAQGESGQAQLTSSSRGVILSWLERKDASATLRFSELTSGSWTGARTIASSDRWFVSDADTPTVMRMSDGTLVAAIYPVVDVRIEAYDLRLTYSRDDGKTWAPLMSPHHDKTRTQHGFASLFELPGRSLGVVWLDGRDQELNTSDPLGGSMDVYFASFDSNWKQNAEASINTRVCECCQTATAVSADGPVVAFRDRSDQEIRDIHVSRVEDGKWTEAVPVHADKWQIDACPVNGPALSARGKTVAVAWFTAAGGTGHAYAAFSQDAGRTWSEPIRLDDGSSLGQVDIELLDDGSAVATWLEFATEVEGRTQVRTRRVKPSRERSASVILAGADEPRVSGYPHLARSGNELVFAWSETMGGPQQVKAAIGTLK